MQQGPREQHGQQVTVERAIEIGREHQRAGRLGEAEQVFRQVMAHVPGRVEAMNDLGMVIGQQRRYAEAEGWLRRAVELDPGYLPAWHNLAVSAEHRGSPAEAVGFLRRAIEVAPEYWDNHYRLALALKKLNEVEAALAAVRRALELRPEDPEVHGVHATLALLNGEFETGWREYEWRWRCASFPDERRAWSAVPDVATTDLGGKRVVVYTEQGYGDTIQFVRYVPMLARRGAEVAVVCPVDVREVVRWVPGVREVVALKGAVRAGDYTVPMMSLPLAFRTTPGTVPADVPYVVPPRELVAKWRGRLEPYKGLKVGIAWAGRPTHKQDGERTVRLAQLARLGAVPGVTFFSLQKGPAAAEANPPPKGIAVVNLTAGLADFADTAGMVANLDLVIAVDTAVVHLAGAMGKRVWTLLALAPDWRWLRDREDSPWYPTMRLFRQRQLGGWDEVFARVETELRRLAAGAGVGG